MNHSFHTLPSTVAPQPRGKTDRDNLIFSSHQLGRGRQSPIPASKKTLKQATTQTAHKRLVWDKYPAYEVLQGSERSKAPCVVIRFRGMVKLFLIYSSYAGILFAPVKGASQLSSIHFSPSTLAPVRIYRTFD